MQYFYVYNTKPMIYIKNLLLISICLFLGVSSCNPKDSPKENGEKYHDVSSFGFLSHQNCRMSKQSRLLAKNVTISGIKALDSANVETLLKVLGKPDSIGRNFVLQEDENLVQYWYKHSFFVLDSSEKIIIGFDILDKEFELCPLGLHIGQKYATYRNLLPNEDKEMAAAKDSIDVPLKLGDYWCRINTADRWWGFIYIYFKNDEIVKYCYRPNPRIEAED